MVEQSEHLSIVLLLCMPTDSAFSFDSARAQETCTAVACLRFQARFRARFACGGLNEAATVRSPRLALFSFRHEYTEHGA